MLEMRAAPGCFVCIVGGCWANNNNNNDNDSDNDNDSNNNAPVPFFPAPSPLLGPLAGCRA